MKKPDIRTLRDEAQKAVDKAKWAKAVEIYGQLAAVQPVEPLWPHRAGEALRKVGDKLNAIVAFRKAADLYHAAGFLLKAIAIWKKIDKLDATALEPKVNLGELYAKQGLMMEAKSQYQIVVDEYV